VKIAGTIGDFDCRPEILSSPVAEAGHYGSLDRRPI
jgi:hypothetical protein